MLKLRPFQNDMKNEVHNRWGQGDKNTLLVGPTGCGKTVIIGDIVHNHKGASCVIAHRQELVGQISLALAENGVHHRIIGPASVIKMVNMLHVYVLGRSYYDPTAMTAVAGVNTLVRRYDSLQKWLPQVGLWVLDEAHHLLQDNIWGRAVAMFPNAKGLGVTATPRRADGAGLGRHADGLFDSMTIGPTGRDLINQGYLSDYRIFAPPSDINFDNVKISQSTGDYVKNQLVKATEESCIMGDMVDNYLKIAPGKLGVMFLPSVDIADSVAKRFNGAGVPAKMVSAKTPTIERVKILQRFKTGDIKVLVNCDLFGEGFDLPALEVVSFGRKTESFALFSQQFGRCLRLSEGKTHGIIIDHVGNVARHGLPDTKQNWSLDRRERTKSVPDPDLIPVRTCIACTAVYEAWSKVCPYCGARWIPAERTTPKQVDGDLEELDPAALAALRAEVDRIDVSADSVKTKMNYAGLGPIVANSAAKRHRTRQEIQSILRANIMQWSGNHRAAGRADNEIYTRFYRQFGYDMMTAQTLGQADAESLNLKVVTECY